MDIKNIVLESPKIVGGRINTGGLIGSDRSAGSLRDRSRITNIVIRDLSLSSGDLPIGRAAPLKNVGGLIGSARGRTTINKCKIEGGNIGSFKKSEVVGGLVGQGVNVNISLSSSTADVIAKEAIGGLIGIISGISTVESSYARGDLTGTKHVGGLIGKLEGATKVSECYATGNVTGYPQKSNKYFGGLIGVNLNSDGQEVINSYARGDVDINAAWGSFTGGFIGYRQSLKITNSYSTGSVADFSQGKAEGFGAGDDDGRGRDFNVTNSFWNTETSGISAIKESGDVSWGKTNCDMKSAQLFLDSGWDFVSETDNGAEDIWDMDQLGTVNNGYPILSWQEGNDEILAPFPGGGTELDPYEISHMNHLGILSTNCA